MATTPAATPIYHDPIPSQTRGRRSSSRKSFVSPMSRSASTLESPRTSCPKDGDAFSYNPAHLRAWYLPEDVWARLPAQLRLDLAAVQHSGAAVLTGFERMDKHAQELDSSRDGHHVPDQLLVHLEDLPPPKYRSVSNASSVFFHSDVSSPASAGSPASQSGCGSPVTSSFFQSSISQSQIVSPLSPVSLGPSAMDSDKPSRSRERSFSTPLEPQDAYYTTELSHLRTEALPRLRHAARKVDTEWSENKRTGAISSGDINAFENWWAEKKCNILSLNEKGKHLATIHGLASTGMGWCAP